MKSRTGATPRAAAFGRRLGVDAPVGEPVRRRGLAAPCAACRCRSELPRRRAGAGARRRGPPGSPGESVVPPAGRRLRAALPPPELLRLRAARLSLSKGSPGSGHRAAGARRAWRPAAPAPTVDARRPAGIDARREAPCLRDRLRGRRRSGRCRTADTPPRGGRDGQRTGASRHDRAARSATAGISCMRLRALPASGTSGIAIGTSAGALDPSLATCPHTSICRSRSAKSQLGASH